MQIPPHTADLSVAGSQHLVPWNERRRLTAAGLLGVGLCATTPAAAAEPSHEGPPTPAQRSYAGMLGAAYAVAPVFALGVGGFLSAVEARDEVAVLAASTMFLLPMSVHLYQGDAGAGARAGLSVVSMVGITFGGTLAGGVGGYLENKLSCDPDQNSECDDRGIGTTILGAAIGSIVGYVGSAFVDVAFRSETEAPEAPSESAQLWVTPLHSATDRRSALPAERRSGRAAPTAADGLLLGLTLRL